jgi:hypothetical protein
VLPGLYRAGDFDADALMAALQRDAAARLDATVGYQPR